MSLISDCRIRNEIFHSRLRPLIVTILGLVCAAHCARAQKCDPPPADIVSWWSGESNALDNLGLNNGTYVGTPTYAPGEDGYAFSFNGTSQYVDVPNSPSLQFLTNITLEAWAYPTAYASPGGASSILVKYDAVSGRDQCSWSFGIDPRGPGFILISTNGLSGVPLYSVSDCPLNTWTHLAATYDGNNVIIYINGNAENSAALSGNIFPGTDDVGIGANLGGEVVALFTGLIDEPTIYSRALSATEIQAIYNAASYGKCPLSPTIFAQPTNQTVLVGASPVFSVGASGGQPLIYQWQLNGTNLSGANAASLVLNDVQFSQAGTYTVTVSNAAAAGNPVLSSNAMLTVLPAPPCFPAPSNIVSWWAGEGNALDNLSANNGTLIGSPSFANGKVGRAFSFNGSSQFVRVPDSPSLHITNAITLEAWVNPTSYNPSSSSSVLVKWDAIADVNQACWSFGIDGNGPAFFGISTTGSNATFVYTTNLCPLSTWTHLAASYDGTNLIIYFNGVPESSVPLSGNIFPGTDALGIGACIGAPDGEYLAVFKGLIDEATVYNRALSSNEIQDIYSADLSGKCPLPLAIIAQPTNQTVFAETSAFFSAGISGSQPVTYQWEFNGAPISGATNSSLTVSNTQPTNAGNYSLLVSNSVNSAHSSNAALNVILVSAFGNGVLLSNAQYTFTNSVSIRLTNYLPSGDIFYTLDGSTPTAGSTLYSAPFVITNTSIIRALGYSADFVQSSLSTPVSILIPPLFALTATTAGGGNITLSPSNAAYVDDAVVTVTATPSNGWIFLQWLGDTAGTNATNSVIVDRNKSVLAVFGTTVSSTVGGNGSVVFNPAGGIYPYGTILQASAIPQSGNFFVLWGDAASGNTNPLAFHITNANPTISALFTGLGGGEFALAVVPVGHGTVAISPQANSYAVGTSVSITAAPNSGHAFLGWSGGASGTNNPLNIQLNSSETIYANFTTNNSLLIYPVTPPGTGDGMVVDLLGELGTQYRLDASTNLSNWTTLYNLTNTVGTLHYIDLNATNLTHRFYRGVIIVP